LKVQRNASNCGRAAGPATGGAGGVNAVRSTNGGGARTRAAALFFQHDNPEHAE
jgi:hypothetical protein